MLASPSNTTSSANMQNHTENAKIDGSKPHQQDPIDLAFRPQKSTTSQSKCCNFERIPCHSKSQRQFLLLQPFDTWLTLVFFVASCENNEVVYSTLSEVGQSSTDLQKPGCPAFSTTIRLAVYSFLPIKALLTKIGMLCTRERRVLQNSSITRINRTCKVRITEKDSLQSDNVTRLTQANSVFQYAVNIVSDIEVLAAIETSSTAMPSQTVSKLRDFILSLPSWFD